MSDWAGSDHHRTNVRRKAARKVELFEPWVKGDVLHVGFGGGKAGRPNESGWFHEDLADLCEGDLLGIDLDEAAVKDARGMGYDVAVADATDFDIDREFDTIAIPNIIEHVSNPGLLLDCCRAHLRPGGWLLITTDRMMVPWWLLQTIKNGGSPEPYPEHTMHFCREHLEEILDRAAFDVEHYQPYGYDRVGITTADRAWRVVEKLLTKVPELSHIDKVQHFVVAAHTDTESA